MPLLPAACADILGATAIRRRYQEHRSMSTAERHYSSPLDATALGADIALGVTTAQAAMQQALDLHDVSLR